MIITELIKDKNKNIIAKRNYDTKYKFEETYSFKTGKYCRLINDNQEGEPFLRSFPGLLDIGIMGGCKCASAKTCHIDCYQGYRPYNPNKDMSFDDYKKIILEGEKKGLQQVALGGAGNPNDHKDFIKIIKFTREHNIIPNYTTAGIDLTDEAVLATKKYCGAVAVSWHKKSSYTYPAIQKFIKAGVKTNIHFVLSKNTIDEAIDLLKTGTLELSNKVIDIGQIGINAVIFLLYKPVGLGKHKYTLSIKEDEEKLNKFFELIDQNINKKAFKIGFDSCTIPGIINFAHNISKASIDTCEGSRFSAYINSDLIMVPCSFDQSLKWGVSLKRHNIEEAWNSVEFNNFRIHFDSCPNCPNHSECHGGCPIESEIVLCNLNYRENKISEKKDAICN